MTEKKLNKVMMEYYSKPDNIALLQNKIEGLCRTSKLTSSWKSNIMWAFKLLHFTRYHPQGKVMYHNLLNFISSTSPELYDKCKMIK